MGQERLAFASSKESGTSDHQLESLDEFELTTNQPVPQESIILRVLSGVRVCW